MAGARVDSRWDVIKYRVITGTGVKAKRTFTEFLDKNAAIAFSGGRPVQTWQLTWIAKERFNKTSTRIINTTTDCPPIGVYKETNAAGKRKFDVITNHLRIE